MRAVQPLLFSRTACAIDANLASSVVQGTRDPRNGHVLAAFRYTQKLSHS